MGSLNPTANNHIQTTSFTLQVHMRLHGLAPEHALRREGAGRPDPSFDFRAAQQALAEELQGYADLSTHAHGAAADGAAADADHSGCGAAVSLFSDGLEVGDSRRPRLNCSAADDGASTEIDFECVECNLASSQIDLRFSLASRFAMAQAIEWQAAVRWSQAQQHGRCKVPTPQRSSSASAAPHGAPGGPGRLGTCGVEARPLGGQPLPCVLERAASTVADSAAF